MRNSSSSDIVITGLGITSAIGQGKQSFLSALLQGKHKFGVMQRDGRQIPDQDSEKSATAGHPFLGAEISSLDVPETIPGSVLRTASFSSQVALATLHEAWTDADLDEFASDRIGLIAGGSNFQQRELLKMRESYLNRTQFLRPTYGMCFLDSDLCGLCTEHFSIRGFAYTLGGASASGQLAVIKAVQAVISGEVDICIAIGTLMDLSFWEFQGLRSLGAMGSDRFFDTPALACRPFDQDRDGFIYGEACGAVVVEKENTKGRKQTKPYARISGSATGVDANRNPNPSAEGEVHVVKNAMKQAGLSANQIDYVNPHGTASPLGDKTELEALKICGLQEAYINATKSIAGHALTAAGSVDIIATVLQMQEGVLHPTLNLDSPIDNTFNWVRRDQVKHSINNAISLSMGFGGVNSAICLQRI